MFMKNDANTGQEFESPVHEALPSQDTMAVIIRGHVFDYKEKAPFVASGKSVLGALEYDPEKAAVKCHECGDWFQCISHTHLRDKHRITITRYKDCHGLNATSALCTPEFSAMRRRHSGCAGNPERTAILVASGREHKRMYGNNRSNRGASNERANELGRCQAQSLFRIQLLAADLGRTPTAMELKKSGLDDPLLVRRFGSAAKALELAGLKPRGTGRPSKPSDCSLPLDFPTKKQLIKGRMPWPKEYFQASSHGLSYSPQSTLGGAIYQVGGARKHQSAE